MVKLSKKELVPFLRPDSVVDGVVAEIIDEGRITNSFGRDRFQCTIKIGEKKYIFAMNQTTLNRLIDAFGNDTANWVGKKIKITKVTQIVRGALKEVLYAEPIKQ